MNMTDSKTSNTRSEELAKQLAYLQAEQQSHLGTFAGAAAGIHCNSAAPRHDTILEKAQQLADELINIAEKTNFVGNRLLPSDACCMEPVKTCDANVHDVLDGILCRSRQVNSALSAILDRL
jgi:hypothetical protein